MCIFSAITVTSGLAATMVSFFNSKKTQQNKKIDKVAISIIKFLGCWLIIANVNNKRINRLGSFALVLSIFTVKSVLQTALKKYQRNRNVCN